MNDMNNYRYVGSTSPKEFEHLRRDLPVIMAFAGWTNQYISTLLGISLASFVAIKNENGRMKTIHYLALCKLIDDECRSNQSLREAIDILNERPGESMSRDELVKHVEDEKKRIGTKLQRKKLKPALHYWMLNGADCA